MHADHAPTPFTAVQTRTHCRDGHRLLIQRRVEGAESFSATSFSATSFSATTFSATTFRDGDAEGVTIESVPCDADGLPTGPAESARASWADLQAHASFPAVRTQVRDETLTGPLGTLPCRRYVVAGEQATSTFWFALDHPGMPIRYVSGDAEVSVVAIEG